MVGWVVCKQRTQLMSVLMSVITNGHLELMRDSSKTFPELECSSTVRTARIWHCKYRSLAAIGALTNLEELVIGSMPDLSLEFLGKLSRLRYLSIDHMPSITSLMALQKLTNLEVLSLSTSPGWDAARKCTIVDSLMPLATLPRLKQLQLFGVCPPDKSLRDLQSGPSLESARFSQYPADEIARFFLETGLPDTPAAWASFQ